MDFFIKKSGIQNKKFVHATMIFLVNVISVTSQLPSVLIYTDLKEMLSTDGNCSSILTQANRSTEVNTNQSTQDKILTKLSFQDLFHTNIDTQGCQKVDIVKPKLEDFGWVCFPTGNGSTMTGSTKSKNMDMLFVGCLRGVFMSRNCLNNETMVEIDSKVCSGDDMMGHRCREITISVNYEQFSYRCSTDFFYGRKSSQTQQHEKSSSISSFDMAAYMCAIFIFVSFLLAVFIPAQKCKPTYMSDKTGTPRIPLEIYEMYGVFYKPSAKRKLTANANKWMRRMSKLKPHSKNLALVANLKDLKRKASKGIHVFETKKVGKHVTIANDVNVYDIDPSDIDVQDRDPIALDAINLSLYNKAQSSDSYNKHPMPEQNNADRETTSSVTYNTLKESQNCSTSNKERKFSMC